VLECPSRVERGRQHGEINADAVGMSFGVVGRGRAGKAQVERDRDGVRLKARGCANDVRLSLASKRLEQGGLAQATRGVVVLDEVAHHFLKLCCDERMPGTPPLFDEEEDNGDDVSDYKQPLLSTAVERNYHHPHIQRPPRSSASVSGPANNNNNPASQQDQPTHDKPAILHIVDTSRDTLQGLSLQYDVSIDLLKRANDMTSDRLTSHITLIIPPPRKQTTTTTPRAKMNDTLDPSLWPLPRVESEMRRRAAMEELFQTKQRASTCGEARYYLSANDYNMDLALRQYEKDVAWERKQQQQRKGWWW
jgi:hypothetical protein